MKKVAFCAAAAAMCGSLLAVESANIVGYNNVGLNAGGKNMVGACFVTVGGTKVKLSELKVTGYEKSDYYLGEMAFAASFQRRASNGMPYATYMWADESLDMENWEGGKWVDTDTGNDITTENDVLLNPGDGLWFTTPDLQDCTAFSLTSAGAVLVGDQAFELNAGGKIGVANMLPAPTTLSKIEIQGYEDSEYYLGEMAFAMSMQSLMSNGMPQATYMWADESLDMENWEGGKWVDTDTGSDITTDNDVTIAAGEGFWATAPDLQDCTSFTFVIPKVLAK